MSTNLDKFDVTDLNPNGDGGAKARCGKYVPSDYANSILSAVESALNNSTVSDKV